MRLSPPLPLPLTLATKITLGRVLLVPAFAISLSYHRPDWALFLFLLASLADAADGHLARRRGEMTSLGAMLDPIADKLLMTAAYVLMGASGEIPAWLAVLVVSRDVLLCLGCLVLFMTIGFRTPSPSILGKATAALQMVSVLAALAAEAAKADGGSWLPALFAAAGALTAASGIHYLFFVGARVIAQRETGGRP
ncbi:MAG: CDP-alcohol phosphatidyltransferase family protein [Nitrospinota bacterium]